MESSGQVTTTEEMMINDEGNDASRTCSDGIKELERDGTSVSTAESSCERGLRSGPCHLDKRRHLGQIYDQSEQIHHSGRSRSSNGGETVAKISHGELLIT